MPQKEVECSGEAVRDMANNNATVFENGNSVICLLHFQCGRWALISICCDNSRAATIKLKYVKLAATI